MWGAELDGRLIPGSIISPHRSGGTSTTGVVDTGAVDFFLNGFIV